MECLLCTKHHKLFLCIIALNLYNNPTKLLWLRPLSRTGTWGTEWVTAFIKHQNQDLNLSHMKISFHTNSLSISTPNSLQDPTAGWEISVFYFLS